MCREKASPRRLGGPGRALFLSGSSAWTNVVPLGYRDHRVLFLNKCPWGGACEGRYPYLVHGILGFSLLSGGVSSTRTQLSSHGSNMPSSPLFISWQYFLFLEMTSSGGKSGLVRFPLSGSCCPCWAWRPSLLHSWRVRRDTGKGKWKGSGTPGRAHLLSSGGDETKKLFLHQHANSSTLSPKHHALSLVLSVPSLATIFISLLSSFSTRAWPPCQPQTSP